MKPRTSENEMRLKSGGKPVEMCGGKAVENLCKTAPHHRLQSRTPGFGPTFERGNQNQNLIEVSLPWVESLARTLAARVPRHVLYDDLFQTGVLALMRCAPSYDPSLGFLFRTFAQPAVRGAMVDMLRSTSSYSRRNASAPHFVDLNTVRLLSTELSPLEQCERAETYRKLHAALLTLPVNERLVLEIKYFQGKTMMGAGLGVSQGRVSQIHRRALAQLKRALSV